VKITILGSSGFIGSHLRQALTNQGYECAMPARDAHLTAGQNLGHVLYCIGVTADFRTRRFDTVRGHVTMLMDILEHARFDSLLYFSSTRVYSKALHGSENLPLSADPNCAEDLYNVSKLMGETLCLSDPRETVRVVRLSNVYGLDPRGDNFLTSIIRAAVREHAVDLETSLDSSKDYVSIEDVISVVPRIATAGRQRLYNVAAGTNLRHEDLVKALTAQTHCAVNVRANAKKTCFPRISIERIQHEFAFAPRSLLHDMKDLVKQYRSHLSDND
jgi:nucleoside-diphosphate-sugar epimerase